MLKPELAIILLKSREIGGLMESVFLIEEVECEDIALRLLSVFLLSQGLNKF